jgi:transposase
MKAAVTEEIISRQPPEAQTIIRLLLEKIASQEAEIAELKARTGELERQVKGKTPQNSSLPPSTKHPHARWQPPRRKSKKKRGGQPGHEKHERPLIPTDQCDKVQTLKPIECRRCSEKLSGTDPEPLRHQVWELPEIKPHVTEYQQHRLVCPCCGESTCAELPAGVPVGQAGPRLVAFVALLMAYFRQSKRRTALFLETILQQPCSAAWTVKLQKQATDALRPSYDELAAALPQQSHLGIDETPNKEGPLKTWLWAFVAAPFTVFALRSTRAATVLGDLLTDCFDGVVMCDRAKMYWCLERLQWCWAHLKRDFQALIDSDDSQVKRLGNDLMRPTRKLFAAWARYRDGTLTRAGMKRLMITIRAEIEGLLLRGAFSGNKRLVGMCNELYDHRQWLWTFLDHENVEPTNNGSERALRHAVIWRKLSFGTQSASGSRFVETMLTVIETCRQQRRNTFTFVADAVHAHFAGHSPASLLANV